MNNQLDGNATAGLLQAIFPFDMTSVQATCTGCGATETVAALAVYIHGMGTIMRCPSCDHVLIRVVQGGGRTWLDLQGVRVLQIATD